MFSGGFLTNFFSRNTKVESQPPEKAKSRDPKKSNRDAMKELMKDISLSEVGEPRKVGFAPLPRKKATFAPLNVPRKSAKDIGFGIASSSGNKTLVTTKSGKDGVLLDYAEDEFEHVGILRMMNGKITVRDVGAFEIDDEFDDSESSFDMDLYSRQKSLHVQDQGRRTTNYVLARGTTDHARTIMTSLPILRETTREKTNWTEERHFWTRKDLDTVNERRLKAFPPEDPEPTLDDIVTQDLRLADYIPSNVEPRVNVGKKVTSEVYHWHKKRIHKFAYAYRSTCAYETTITIDFAGSSGLKFRAIDNSTKIQGHTVTAILPPFGQILAVLVDASGAYELQVTTRKSYAHVDNSRSQGAVGDIAELQNEAIQVRVAAMESAGAPSGASVLHWLHNIGQRFIDIEFPPLPQSIFESHSHKESVVFRRYTDLHPGAKIFVDFGVRPSDVVQGKLGNCWLMSSVAALSEQPDLVDKLFLTQEINQAGVYQTKLCVAGMWETFTLDQYFPCTPNGYLIYTKSKSSSMWASLLEKSFAKYYGSYERLDNNDPEIGLYTLTGKPTGSWFIAETDNRALWGHIMHSIGSKDLVTMSTVRDEQKVAGTGLVVNHAYTIIRAKEGLGKRLVCLRNPWGKQEWKGNWSDGSRCWTRRFREMFQPSLDPNDGTFWMDFDEAAHYFEKLNVCFCEHETKVTRMPMNCGLSNSGEYSYYSLTMRVPRDGHVVWIGLHQIDPMRQGACPYDPLVCLLFRRTEASEHGREPVASFVALEAFKFENLDLGPGEYDLLIFHCGRKSDACEDTHTSTLTIHGRGPKFSVEAELLHDPATLERGLVEMALGLGERKEHSRDLVLYNYSGPISIWAAQDMNRTLRGKKYCAQIEASVRCRNKAHPYFVPNPNNIRFLLEPGASELLTVAVTKEVCKTSSVSRSFKVNWMRIFQ